MVEMRLWLEPAIVITLKKHDEFTTKDPFNMIDVAPPSDLVFPLIGHVTLGYVALKKRDEFTTKDPFNTIDVAPPSDLVFPLIGHVTKLS